MQECDLDLIYLPYTEAIVFWADDIIEYSSIFFLLSEHLYFINSSCTHRMMCLFIFNVISYTYLIALMCFQVYFPTIREYIFKKKIFNKLMDLMFQVGCIYLGNRKSCIFFFFFWLGTCKMENYSAGSTEFI